MAFLGILVLYGVLMVLFGMVALGVLGLMFCLVFLPMWRGAKRRQEKRQAVFLALAVAGGVLAVMGSVVLALLWVMLS